MIVIMWLLDLQLPVQPVPITTNIDSSNSANGEVHSIQHHVINTYILYNSYIYKKKKKKKKKYIHLYIHVYL
jgi:hypothetical protein